MSAANVVAKEALHCNDQQQAPEEAEQLYPSLINLQVQEEVPEAIVAGEAVTPDNVALLWKRAIKETINYSNCSMPGGAWMGFGTGVLTYLCMKNVDYHKADNLLPFLALVFGTTLAGHVAGKWLPIGLLTFGGIYVLHPSAKE